MDPTLPITIRDSQLDPDGPAVVALINAFERIPITLAQYQSWEAHLPEGRVSRRRVAEDGPGALAGYSQVSHETWEPPGLFYLWTITDPAYRGQGVGSALFEDALTFAQAQGATMLRSEVLDDDESALGFTTRRGFHVDRHHYQSVLDLAGFDESPYAGLLVDLQAQGIRFFSMADQGDTLEDRRKLYEVNLETGRDIPGSDGDWMPFDEFNDMVCGSSWYNPRGQLFAAEGDQWIGLAAVRLYADEKMAYNLMTGVRRPYRGRKIAQALKLLAIRYARENGMTTLRTENDSHNAPMLAVNRKLGYRPLPGKYFLKFELA